MGINNNSFICKYYETQQKFLKYFALLYKCNKKQKYGFLTVNRKKNPQINTAIEKDKLR